MGDRIVNDPIAEQLLGDLPVDHDCRPSHSHFHAGNSLFFTIHDFLFRPHPVFVLLLCGIVHDA